MPAPILADVLDMSDADSAGELSDDAVSELNEMDEECVMEEAGGEGVDLGVPAVAGDAGAARIEPPICTVDDLVWYPSGRIYEFGTRQIGTCIRGKPAGSVYVKCGQRHGNCKFVAMIGRGPTDDEVKEWLLAVPRGLDSDTKAQKDARREAHLRLADRWKAPPKAALAKPPSAAASSSSIAAAPT